MGGGFFCLGNLEGGGVGSLIFSEIHESWGGGEGGKDIPIHRGGGGRVDIFCNNPMIDLLLTLGVNGLITH